MSNITVELDANVREDFEQLETQVQTATLAPGLARVAAIELRKRLNLNDDSVQALDLALADYEIERADALSVAARESLRLANVGEVSRESGVQLSATVAHALEGILDCRVVVTDVLPKAKPKATAQPVVYAVAVGANRQGYGVTAGVVTLTAYGVSLPDSSVIESSLAGTGAIVHEVTGDDGKRAIHVTGGEWCPDMTPGATYPSGRFTWTRGQDLNKLLTSEAKGIATYAGGTQDAIILSERTTSEGIERRLGLELRVAQPVAKRRGESYDPAYSSATEPKWSEHEREAMGRFNTPDANLVSALAKVVRSSVGAHDRDHGRIVSAKVLNGRPSWAKAENKMVGFKTLGFCFAELTTIAKASA